MDISIRWFVDFQAEVEIRGLHASSKIRVKKDVILNGHMEGSLIVSLPWTSSLDALDLGHPTFHLQGSPLWTLVVPDTIQESTLRKLTHSSLDTSFQEASLELSKAWTFINQSLQSK